ncbi:MAG: histidinol phosphate phosphatase domain-containing protein [Methanomicrobiales archaeon]|nr:histidinol phosphate phosphatase domain-containing protein [Methanomicrobiales archaeon]
MYDLHTHTLLSDGELLPTELIRRAAVLGYTVLGISDHADPSNLSGIIASVAAVRDCADAYGVELLCGVELTHVPPAMIDRLARRAKEEGADIVIVHGETVVEPVAPGTNRAACRSRAVDILAHPGLLSAEDAANAAKNGTALEITARCGHNRTNGHVLAMARAAGCRVAIGSDAHAPGDLMTRDARRAVARGAGMSPEEEETALSTDILAWLRSGRDYI